MNDMLRDQNNHIRNSLQMRREGVLNSLASLSLPGFGNSAYLQTPITSFNPILQNNVYAPLTLDWTVLIYAYKTHGIIQTLIDTPVLDALRGGIDITSDELGEDEKGELQDQLDHHGILDKIATARRWTRLFGGGGLIVSTESPMDQPLDFRQLAHDGRFELYPCNRWELSAPWKTAEMYQFYGKSVHHSRVILMSGKEAPYILRWQLSGWGMSELERVIEDFNTYIRIKNVIYELLYEAKVDVYRFKDFAAQMLSSEAEAQTNRRMQIMNNAKNYNAALLLDKEDEFEQKQLTFSGLAEIYTESRIELCSALRFPFSKLFGTTAGGASLANSSQDDLENYNGMIESEERRPLRPAIRKVLDILCVALFGDTYDLDFEFKPLRILGAKEEEEVKTFKFNRLNQIYQQGLISPQDYGEMLKKEKLVDGRIQIQDDAVPIDRELDREDAQDLPEDQTLGVGVHRND